MKTTYKIIILTLIFFVLLIIITAAAWGFQDAADRKVESIYVIIAVIPFIIYLILSDKLKGFKGGGIELILRDAADKEVSGYVADDKIEVSPEPQMEKQSLDMLHEKIRSQEPSTLSFIIGRSGYYSDWAVNQYIESLTNMPAFRYILFKDANEKFMAYMSVDDFENIVLTKDNFIKLIESGDVMNLPGIRKGSIRKNAKNKQALAKMDALNITELAVVDEKDRFLGTLSQDEIVRKVLSGIIRDA
ncbi:MAG: hypothetical protein P8X42_15050 [Calditrichaceae bacterium]|jgi:CBS domain-containing protein